MAISLETERLIIRDLQESDLMNLHRLLSDKNNMYYLDDIVTNSLEESAQNLKLAMANKDGHYFCLCNKNTGEYIGEVGYTITAETPIGKIVHMGYFILPEYHGRGYTTEAVRKVIEFAFMNDKCIRITTGCYKDNIPSMRVMEKSGFRKEGERIKAEWHDGQMKDRLDYAINKDEYILTGDKK